MYSHFLHGYFSPASVRTGSVSSVFSRSSTSSVEPSSPATNKENKPVKGRKSLLQTPRAGKAGTVSIKSQRLCQWSKCPTSDQ